MEQYLQKLTTLQEQAKGAYADYLWIRFAASLGLLICGALLYWLPGGFPPGVWRLFSQVLPQVPVLWQTHGWTIIPPLLGLALLSLSFPLMWVILATIVVKVILYTRSIVRERQQFVMELQRAEPVAEELAEQVIAHEIVTLAARQPMPVAVGAEWETIVSPDPELAQQLVTATAGRVQADETAQTPLPPSSRATRPHLRILPRTIEKRAKASQEKASSREPSLDDEDDEEEKTLCFTMGAALHPGLKRKGSPNEDTLLMIQCTRTTNVGPQPVSMAVVADGMGGHANGQEASRLSVEALSAFVLPPLLSDVNKEVTYPDLLSEGVRNANLAIYRRNWEQPSPAMMGTTMAAALIIDATAYIVNVGDSRAYLYRELEGLSQITRDHSLVSRLVEDGVIAREEMYTHPKRNQIYRCLGEQALLEIDAFEVSLQAHDALLLCSDGLWEMVRDPSIEKILKSGGSPQKISDKLVQAALNCGGADNISVVVVCAELV